jgi:hypothetical protein
MSFGCSLTENLGFIYQGHLLLLPIALRKTHHPEKSANFGIKASPVLDKR